MSETNRRWVFPSITVSQNKGIERIGLTGNTNAYELAGVDGSRRFGCRPYSGFKFAHSLNILADFTSLPSADRPPAQTKTSQVTDCFPVHFQIREGEYGHGFVYRVKNYGLSLDSAVFMDYVPTNTVDGATGWRTVLISDHTSGNHVSSNEKMDVVSMGKYVFTFVKGRQPRVFYVDLTGSTYSHKVINGGPGKAPELKNLSSLPSPVFETQVGATTGRAGVPSGSPIGLLTSTLAGSGDPGNNSDEVDFHAFKSGDYSFAYYLHDSHTGRRTSLSTIGRRSQDEVLIDNKFVSITTEIDTSKFDEIYLFRSVKQQSVGTTYAGSILHLDTIYKISDAVVSSDAAYKGINEVSVASNSNYTDTTFKIYKCFYQLDDIALSMQDIYLDKILVDEKMPFVGSAVAFGGSLILSDPKGEGATLTTELDSRTRDIGEIRWSSLTERSPEIFPINNKHTPDIFQNRVTALARSGEFAIGFSADRIYHIRRNGTFIDVKEMHEGFGLASPNGFASAGPLVYFVTTKGLKAVSNNGQLDDVKALDNLLMDEWFEDLSSIRLSFDSYSSCLFVMNTAKKKTVCLWFGSGRITEVHDTEFQDVRSGIWPKTFTQPSDDNGAWSATGSPVPTASSEMVNRSFFLQNFPVNYPTLTGAGGDIIKANWRPRVYVQDYDRAKTGVNSTDTAIGSPVIRTLDSGGDSVFTVRQVTVGTADQVVVLKSGTAGSKKLGGQLAEGTDCSDLIGCYVYVLSSINKFKVGLKFQIVSASGGTVLTDGSGNKSITVIPKAQNTFSLEVGDVLSVNPVYFHWVGPTIPMIKTEKGNTTFSYDLFQNKQISSVGCHFTDVSGGVTGHKFYRGEVWNSTSNSASVQAIPSDFAGTQIGDSVENGESSHYAAFKGTDAAVGGKHGIQDSVLNPGLEIFCPDLDFKLMAVICRGRTTSTDTSERVT